MKAYQRGYFGVSINGNPFYIDRAGSIDVPKIKQLIGIRQADGTLNLDKMWNDYIFQYEELLKLRFPACSITQGVQIDKTITVIDLTGFSISKLWNKETIAFVKEAAKIGQDYYPEIVG